jgi:hypothetical protein
VVVKGGSAGVKDLAGNAMTADYTFVFTTGAAAAPPVANAGADKTGNEGSAVSFTGSATGGEGALTYSWNFGDGGTATGQTVSRTYADNGTFTVTLTVTDSLGRSSTDTAVVTVSNVAPTGSLTDDNPVIPGQSVNISFSNQQDPSSADTTAGFRYSYDFNNDGTFDTVNVTTPSVSYVFNQVGNYTVRGRIIDKDGGWTDYTTIVDVVAPSGRFNDPYIVTPYDTIPNFGMNATVYTVASGNWSNVNVWSTGRLPGAGDVVSIDAGFTVTYDTVSDAALNTVVVQAGGHLVFRTDANTRLTVRNLLVLQNGELQIGIAANPVAATAKAEVIFPDIAIDTSKDPNEWGHGLIGLGKVTMHGAAKPEGFIRLAAEPRVGQATLTLTEPAVGWRVGDRVILPDTRQLSWNEHGSNYRSQVEVGTIAAISTNGLTITLAAPLAYDHLGARNANGVLEFLPHVSNITRNVVVKSQSSLGTRGHVVFTNRADLDVRYVQFAGLGRTKIGELGEGFSKDRTPVQFRHLFGPQTAQVNGYQYTFIGNSVVCLMNDYTFAWGINVNDSHYGLIQGNVSHNWAAAGFVTRTGNESYNVIENNLVVGTGGSSERVDDFGRSGSGFWLRGPNNYVRDNVATSLNGGGGDVYTYGFNIYARYVGVVNVPTSPGADPRVAGRSVNMNSTPLLEFARNEVYGATASGLSVWWIGTQDEIPYAGFAGATVKDFRVWNHRVTGLWGYHSYKLILDGFVARGDVGKLSGNGLVSAMGIYFNDYTSRALVIKNSDIQGLSTGIYVPYNVGRDGASVVDTTLVQNTYLANETNVFVSPPRTVISSSGLSGRRLILDTVTFAHPAALSQSRWTDIDMANILSDSSGTANLGVTDEVFVYNYNGNAADDFQVFYTERSPSGTVSRVYIQGRVRAL